MSSHQSELGIARKNGGTTAERLRTYGRRFGGSRIVILY
jgi:hypothetical protein